MRKNLLMAAMAAGSLAMVRPDSAAGAGVNSRDLVAAVLIGEAGGEKDYTTGMAAVYEVILNRSIASGRSLESIVLQRKQFSCLNGVDIRAYVAAKKHHPRWDAAMTIVNASQRVVLTHGATCYINPDALKKMPPCTEGQIPVAKIGHHWFYKLDFH